MAITNLTGYKWVGNETIDLTTMTSGGPVDFFVNFKWSPDGINTYEYTELYFRKIVRTYLLGTDGASFYENGWTEDYPLGATLTFTGGVDATNSELIAWLEANGTLTKTVPDFTETKTALKIYEDLTAEEYGFIEKEPNTFYLVNGVGVYKGDKLISTNVDISNKQDTLVSGTNIKTLNGESILGSGNIETMTEEQVQTLIDNAIGTTLQGDY